jgi:translation initiation factor 3 subunit C
MSRFFAASSSGTSSDDDTTSSEEYSQSDSNSELSDAEEVQPEQTVARNRWIIGAEGASDSDSDDGARVVKSQKEKKYDEMRYMCENMIDSLRDRDWVLVETGKLLSLFRI